MPISGVVITSRPLDKAQALQSLSGFAEVEVYGVDDMGNIIAVLETRSSEEMERLIDRISKDKHVLHVGLAYLNTEDEAERLKKGESVAKPFGFRQPLVPVREQT